MEIAEFFKLLKRYKLVLIIVPLACVVIAFLLVRNLPDSYVSQTQISTGIVDQSQKLPDNTTQQESQISTEFSNLITEMKMRKILNQVSYELMLHDLTGTETFRKPSKIYHDLNKSARSHAITVFSRLYDTHGSLMLWDKDQAGLNMLLTSMQYDAPSIEAKLNVYRTGESDFITVEFTSENSRLSPFVVNTVVKEFIDYHTGAEKGNQTKSIDALDSLLQKKKASIDKKTAALRNYKEKYNIVNVSDESATLYAQLADYESQKQNELKEIAGDKDAIGNIDSKFNPGGEDYAGANSKLSAKILANKELLKEYTDKYITSGYNGSYKPRVDSIQNILTEEINQLTDQNTAVPQSEKTGLRAKKRDLETSSDVANGSIATLDSKIRSVRGQLNELGPHQATIAEMQSSLELDNKEYGDLLDKFNQANVVSDFSTRLHQVELAMPALPTGSKKTLIIANSAVVSEVLCVLVLFVLFYLDDAIKNPKMLANKTGVPVLGTINLIKGQSLDLKKMWDAENSSKMREFKDQLRSIRFEIDQELHNNKVLAITSLGPGEGKTLLGISLAYSYSVINKKVLLIDGNFSNPAISKAVSPDTFIEDYFTEFPDNADDIASSSVSVLGNLGQDITLLEIDSEKIINQRFHDLKLLYDIIIIEVHDMGQMNKAKEWLLFADKIVVVFENNLMVNEGKNTSIKYLKSLGPKFAGWIFNKAVTDEK